MKFLAHTLDGKTFTKEEDCQELKEHLTNVAKATAEFAKRFDAEEVGYVLGLLHDYGKYGEKFQQRIRGNSKRIKADHKTAGAQEITRLDKHIGKYYGMAIVGHHGGLLDSGSEAASVDDGTYYSKIRGFNEKIEKIEKIEIKDNSENNTSNTSNSNHKNNAISQNPEHEKITLPMKIKHKRLKVSRDYEQFSLATYIKMLYSALVDADRIDTEAFCTKRTRETLSCSMEALYEKLDQAIPKSNGSKLSEIRLGILNDCKEKAAMKPGLFSLTVPTGGGKTLSSLSFALKHAIKNNMDRIIYVIPFTSIIEQNADVFRKALGDEYANCVLEHHSNVTQDEEDFKTKWACENWDIPIVVTTNVQFFESFYSNKPNLCRKLHNLANSILIFDEAQAIPVDYLSPCMYAISELVTNYKCTAVLCSATQPEIGNYKYKKLEITEITSNPQDLAIKLARTKYDYIGQKSDEEIIELLRENDQTLVIVNSRKHAYHLYQLAKEFPNVYHLSTLMTPNHRRAILKEVKERISDKDTEGNPKPKERAIVISTQLIEAGVDIDFPLVIRSLGGIDSIIQAGGRSNRENKLPDSGRVFIFEPSSEEGKTPKMLEATLTAGREVINKLGQQAFDLEGVALYFKLLYKTSSSNPFLDKKNILGEFKDSFNFETAAKNFQLIETKTVGIVIQENEEAETLVRNLREGRITNNLIRALGKYTVSVYQHEFNQLMEDHVLDSYDFVYVLNNKQYYKETGLDIFTSENLNSQAIFP